MTQNPKPENPFKFGTAANPKDFIGRKELLKELSNDMKKGYHISLHSERRTGKSSLLKYIADTKFASDFDLPANHISVYIDFQVLGIGKKTEMLTIWKAIANAIAYKLLEGKDSKFAQLFTTISNTIEKEPIVSIGTEFEKAFNNMGKENYKFHLLLDEFESTSVIPLEQRKAFYGVLRSFPARTEKNVSYIIATRTGLMSLEDSMDRNSSPLSNIFSRIISLRPFNTEEVSEMIHNYLSDVPSSAEKLYSQDELLYQYSGYHPFFLNMICSYLYENMDKSDWLDKEVLANLLSKFKKNMEDHHIKFYWTLSSREEQEMMQRLAAGGRINVEQNKNLLEKLKDRSLVIEDKEGNKPRLFSSVFKDWINKYYPIKSQEYSEEILHIGKGPLGIKITQDTELFVDKESGEILGPQGEGTLGIVLYAGQPESKNKTTKKLEVERAIRIPRLLQSDMLLNYHIAEISFYEGKQANRYGVDRYLSGAIFFHNLTEPTNNFIPGDSSRTPCYIGFYLSPGSKYKICLLSEYNAWPPDFANYVKNRYSDVQTLHSIVRDSLWEFKSNEMGQIIFLPYPELNEEDIQKDESEEADRPIFLGRDNLSRLYSENKATGWWFNLPIAGYYWLSADLQRLLNAYLDEEIDENKKENNDSSDNTLTDWKTESWLKLIQNLAEGLVYLHKKGGIHGDIRPANIMTNVDDKRGISPNDFRWIDVGLSNDLTDISDSKKALNMPRPLGEERKTPFYAPERNDIFECEDADKIQIEKKDGKIYLSFLSQRTVDDDMVCLKMKKDGKPIRELGRLYEGDRIQVREFLFDIEIVEEKKILVKNIYELGFGRLLIQKKEKELDTLMQRLNNASISRYKIYKQWSQATDIYGFGVLMLYLFYMRGLCYVKHLETAEKSIIERRLKRERMFEEFIVLLKNQRFLENFLSDLSYHKIEDAEKIWKLDAEEKVKGELTQIIESVIDLDPTMRIIYYGVGKSYRLFIQIVYTALYCLWRKEETDSNLYDSTKHNFNPFCESRLRISSGEFEKSAEMLKGAIDLIVKHELRNLENTDKSPDSVQIDDSHQRNISQTGQIRRLTTQLEHSKEEKEKSEINITQLKKEKSSLENNCNDLKEQKAALEAEIQRISSENSELSRENVMLERNNEKKEKLLSEKQVGLKNLEIQNKNLEQKLSEKDNSLKNLKTQNEKLGKELSEIDNNLKNLEEKYRESNVANNKLNENNKILRSRNKNFEEEIERKNKENASLTNERDILFAQNNEMSQKFKAFGTDLTKFIKEHRNDLKKDMEDNYSKFMVLNSYKKSDVEWFIDDIFNKIDKLSSKHS
ncbi:MAG: hypothetical protein BWK80_41040 [Desulfobacteraceae bacterium IS3]|nr:MAG: hypothetical protein BWK80_41040 [Desulfobacteraceae bacterium IS3]